MRSGGYLTVKDRINIKLPRDTDLGGVPEVIKTGKQRTRHRGGNWRALRVKESGFSQQDGRGNQQV